MLRWGTSGPQTDRRAAPGPARAGGVWLVQIPPASRSPRLARGSRYSERGRGGSVPQLPQATPGCPQALARSLTSRAGLLRSRAFTPKVVPGARLDNRVRLASAVPPVRDEMGGAGRPGPVCGGMAQRDIQPCSAAGRIAPTSSGGGRSCRPEPGARPEGDARSGRSAELRDLSHTVRALPAPTVDSYGKTPRACDRAALPPDSRHKKQLQGPYDSTLFCDRSRFSRSRHTCLKPSGRPLSRHCQPRFDAISGT